MEIDEKTLSGEIREFSEERAEFNEPEVKIKSQIVTKSSNFILKMEKNLFCLFFTNVSEDNRSELIKIIKDQKFEEKSYNILLNTIDKSVIRIHNTEELIQVLFTEFQENNEIKDIITDLIFLSKPYENLSDKDIRTVIYETVNKLALFKRKEEIKQLKQKSQSSTNGEFDKVQYQIQVNEKLKSK